MADTTNWAVPPKQIGVLIFAYPDAMLTIEAARWLWERFPQENIFHCNIPHLERARNLAVREFVQKKMPPQFSHVLFMDRDMRPSEQSDHFMTLDTDLASCRYEVSQPQSWAHSQAFHLGLCRVRRAVFDAVAAPWFVLPMTPDHCTITQCECAYFLTKALAAGFTSANAGWADHKPSQTWGH